MHHFYCTITFYGLVMLLLGSFSSCSTTALLQEGEILYDKTEIDLKSLRGLPPAEKGALKTKLLSITQPKPNDKLFGVTKAKLLVHYAFNHKERGIGHWLATSVGEEPVFLDSTSIESSVKNLERYLFNRGYFYNEISYKTSIKHQKATVTYYIKANQAYKIDSIHYPQNWGKLPKTIGENIEATSLLQAGDQFDVSNLKSERERMVAVLKAAGYYGFNQEYIKFELDSSQQNHKLDIYVRLQSAADSSVYQKHKINRVYVHSEYDPNKPAKFYTDTLQLAGGYYYISPTDARFKHQALIPLSLIRPNDYYQPKNYDYSINHFLELGVFKFVNIRFARADTSTVIHPMQANEQWLDCYILLTPTKTSRISADVEVNNRSQSRVSPSLLGTALTLSYGNRNIFKQAELFDIRAYGGVEFNPRPEDDQSIVNTLEIRGEFSFKFPRIIPIRLNNVSPYHLPTTNIRFGANYLKRFDYYTLNSYNFQFGYDWRRNRQIRHILNPLAISFIGLLDTQAAFEIQLAQNPVLEKSFEEQAIIGTNYTYLYNGQSLPNNGSFNYFRANVEVVGNILSIADDVVLPNKDLKLLGNDYSQYFRTDLEYRRYVRVGAKGTLALRSTAGIGVSYGNSDVMPYIKQFFVGGTNSIRAFKIRNIGPGSFGANTLTDTDLVIDEFDRTGDIKLEANVEYRFNIVSMFKGALFMDMGNIWTIKQETELDPETGNEVLVRPGGQFSPQRFASELGIGVGTGLRLDFSYFVMRFDLATPLRDPRLAAGKRWVDKRYYRGTNANNETWFQEHGVLNLAIGYPF